jgi:hypothetical protein
MFGIECKYYFFVAHFTIFLEIIFNYGDSSRWEIEGEKINKSFFFCVNIS